MAAVHASVEKWKFLDAVYWANSTLLAIGIGAPVTHLGSALLFPYAIGGIIILGLVVSSIHLLVLERQEAAGESNDREDTSEAYQAYKHCGRSY